MALMTRGEFIENNRRHKKQQVLLAFCIAILLFGIPLLGNQGVFGQFDREAFAVFLASIVVAIVGVPLRLRYLTDRLGRRCPGCRKALVGRGAGIVIATGKCSSCGKRVLAASEDG